MWLSCSADTWQLLAVLNQPPDGSTQISTFIPCKWSQWLSSCARLHCLSPHWLFHKRRRRRANESSLQIKGPEWMCFVENQKKKRKKNHSWVFMSLGCTLPASTADGERQRLHSASSNAHGHLSNPGCFCLNMHQSTGATNHSAICRRPEKYCLLEFTVYIFQDERQNAEWLCSCRRNYLLHWVFDVASDSRVTIFSV